MDVEVGDSVLSCGLQRERIRFHGPPFKARPQSGKDDPGPELVDRATRLPVTCLTGVQAGVSGRRGAKMLGRFYSRSRGRGAETRQDQAARQKQPKSNGEQYLHYR